MPQTGRQLLGLDKPKTGRSLLGLDKEKSYGVGGGYGKPGLLEAAKTGWEASVAGLAVREKLPTHYEPQNFGESIVQSVGTMIGDLPAMFAGAVIAGGPTGGVGGMAGAFAMPAAMRELLMQKYEKGEIESFEDFWSRLVDVSKEAAKGYLLGAVTGKAGAVGKAVGGKAGKAISPTMERVAGEVVGTSGEITALTAAGSAMEGRFPTAEDFAHNAVILFGAKGANRGAGLLRRIYVERNLGPAEVTEHIRRDLGIKSGPGSSEIIARLAQKKEFQERIRNSIKRLAGEEEAAKQRRALRERLVEREYRARAEQQGEPTIDVPDIVTGKPKALLPERTEPGYRSYRERIEYEERFRRAAGIRDAERDVELRLRKQELERLERDLLSKEGYQKLKRQYEALEKGTEDATIILPDDASERAFVTESKVIEAGTRGKKRTVRNKYVVEGKVSRRHINMIRAAIEFVDTQYPRLANLTRPMFPKEADTIRIQFMSPMEFEDWYGPKYDKGIAAAFVREPMSDPSNPSKTITAYRGIAVKAFERGGEGRSWERKVPAYINSLVHELTHALWQIRYGDRSLDIPGLSYAKQPSEIASKAAGVTAEARYKFLQTKAFDRMVMEVQQELDGFGAVLQGTREAIRGLYELGGGKRAGFLPQEFTEQSWKEARPYLKRAFVMYRKAGMDFTKFSADIIEQFGDKAIPFLNKMKESEGLEITPVDKVPEHPAAPTLRELGKDIYEVPEKNDIHFLRQFVSSPEYVVRNFPEAQRVSGQIIEGQLKASHNTHAIDEPIFDEIVRTVHEGNILQKKTIFGKGMREARERKIRSAMEKLYELRSKNPEEANKLIASDPLYHAANLAVNYFENMKSLIVQHKQEMFARQMSKRMFDAFTEVFELEKKFVPTEEVKSFSPKGVSAEVAKKRNVDAEELWENVKEFREIQRWGIKDYITNIERGMWRVMDSEGKVRRVGMTRREATRKAEELKKAEPGIGKLTVTPEFQKSIDPTKPREDILWGEENIVKALKTYSYLVRKKLALEPVEAAMEKAFEEDVGQINFPPGVRNLLRNQMKDAKGRYSWGDRMFDALAKGFKVGKLRVPGTGGKPFMFTRSVAAARSVTGDLKLGYRPVAAFVNLGAGHGHTWVKVGNEYMRAGVDFLKTPEGRRFIAEEEAYLGMDFAMGEAGKLTTKQAWWKPLYMFGKPEPGIRKLSLAANYLWGKNRGLTEEAARIEARKALRFQNFTYNTAALPRALRGPGGRLVFQFKTYFVKELEFIASLRGKEIARYAGMQLALSGPRGLLYMVKSIPILGLSGALDKLDEWLLHPEIGEGETAEKVEKGLGMVTRGIPGLIGADITAPATFQFMGSSPEDLAGPFLGDLLKLYKVTVTPMLQGEGYIKEDVIDWAKALPVVLKYWETFLQAQVTDDGWIRERIGVQQTKDGKVLAPLGDKRYFIGGEWERRRLQILSMMGAQDVSKTQVQLAERLLAEERKVSINNGRKLGRRILRALEAGKDVDEKYWEELAELGLDPRSIEERMKISEMDPQTRATLRARIVDRARAWGIFLDD